MLLLSGYLFVNPVYAGFDFEKILVETVKEASKSIVNPQSEHTQSDTAKPEMDRNGYILNGGANSDRYNKIHQFYSRGMVKVAPSKYTIEPYLKELEEYCPEKYDTKRCLYAQEQVDVMEGHKIRKEVAQSLQRLKRDRPTYSSPDSLKNLTKAEQLIEQYKLANHGDDRTLSEIFNDLEKEQDIVQAKQRAKQRKEEEQSHKKAKLAKKKWVNDNVKSLKDSSFNSPYKACLAEGEKLIDFAKLTNSADMTKDKVQNTRRAIQEQCACTYLTINTNSEKASKSDRQKLAEDLVEMERRKFKDSEYPPSKHEIKRFHASLNNADASGYAYMKATMECN